MLLVDLPPPSAWMNDKGFVISARGFKDFGQFDKSQPYHIPLYTLDAFERRCQDAERYQFIVQRLTHEMALALFGPGQVPAGVTAALMADPNRINELVDGLIAARGNVGHGHVKPRPDGMKARCGGPKICKECSIELANDAPKT